MLHCRTSLEPHCTRCDYQQLFPECLRMAFAETIVVVTYYATLLLTIACWPLAAPVDHATESGLFVI